MTDVFISYKREERDRCAHIAEKLTALGLDVWFDARLESGTSFDTEIEAQVRSAKAVLVLWSPRAVNSSWVRNEATIGQQRNVLISAELASCTLPIAFTNTHTIPLHGRKIADNDPAWIGVLRRLATLTGGPSLASYVDTVKPGKAVVRRKGNSAVVGVSIAAVALLALGGGGAWYYVNTSGPSGPALLHYDESGLYPDLIPILKAAREARREADRAAQTGAAAAHEGEKAAANARAQAPNTYIEDKDGKHYEGDWANGVREGHGTLKMTPDNAAAGDTFSGQFTGGYRNGWGVYTYVQNAQGMETKLRHEGGFQDGAPNGYVATAYRNGDVQLGKMVNRVYVGPGVLNYSDGRRYEGEFAGNLPHGLGVLWDANGNVITSGVWKEGKIETPYALTSPSARRR